jgi:hypothetical protein
VISLFGAFRHFFLLLASCCLFCDPLNVGVVADCKCSIHSLLTLTQITWQGKRYQFWSGEFASIKALRSDLFF